MSKAKCCFPEPPPPPHPCHFFLKSGISMNKRGEYSCAIAMLVASRCVCVCDLFY